MSIAIREQPRRILPRWRAFRDTAALGELTLVNAPRAPRNLDALDLSFAIGISEWQQDKGLWVGLDLLSSALVCNKVETMDALVRQIQDDPFAPAIAKKLLEARRVGPAGNASYDAAKSKNIEAVGIGKRSLVVSPRDAIGWVDLARAYTILGVNSKAERCIRAALQLSPANRFILRSAARFYVHSGDLDQAHSIIARTPFIKSDPWLLASEIAISGAMHKTSRLTKSARSILELDLPTKDLTELASALGTIDAESGSYRLARRELRRAVEGANENSLAQIGFLNRFHLGEAVDTRGIHVPLLHEANAWELFHDGQHEAAYIEARDWLDDQAFASAPAILASFLLVEMLERPSEAKALLETALLANPDDSGLQTNYAVSLIELGQLDEAEKVLRDVDQKAFERLKDYSFRATKGLLEFRRGNHELGRTIYKEVINDASRDDDKVLAARAAAHLAMEEMRARSPYLEQSLKMLDEQMPTEMSSELNVLLIRLQRFSVGGSTDRITEQASKIERREQESAPLPLTIMLPPQRTDS